MGYKSFFTTDMKYPKQVEL